MTSAQVSAVLAGIAVTAIVTGVLMLVGVAWASITVGVFALAAAILLYDPASKGVARK